MPEFNADDLEVIDPQSGQRLPLLFVDGAGFVVANDVALASLANSDFVKVVTKDYTPLTRESQDIINPKVEAKILAHPPKPITEGCVCPACEAARHHEKHSASLGLRVFTNFCWSFDEGNEVNRRDLITALLWETSGVVDVEFLDDYTFDLRISRLFFKEETLQRNLKDTLGQARVEVARLEKWFQCGPRSGIEPNQQCLPDTLGDSDCFSLEDIPPTTDPEADE